MRRLANREEYTLLVGPLTEDGAPLMPCNSGSNAGDVVFVWNRRDCVGVPLHRAVLLEDLQAVKQLLDAEAGALHARFTYETVAPNGKSQEGSGEAIHIAASRKSVQIVELLVARGARLDAMVTRDGKPHYDVLHSAVFAEGRGGEESIIRCLLEAKAPPTKNLDGHYPLHKAYQSGLVALIPLLAEDMDQRGLLEEAEADWEGPVPTPLQMGIRLGKLVSEQLAKVATLSPVTLKVFIHDEPACIPFFFDRMAQEDKVIPAAELAELLTVRDVCKCLNEHPKAADALLNALTSKPEAENQGWHPVPTRISFGPRQAVDRVRFLVNPPRRLYQLYAPHDTWKFDSKSFKPPEWHHNVTGPFGPPIKDVEIKVCSLSGLIGAEIMHALQAQDFDGDDREVIFGNHVVRAMLNQVWWGGAFKLDVLQFVLTAWGLLMLVMERSLHFASFDHGTASRALLTHGEDGRRHRGDDVSFRPGAGFPAHVALCTPLAFEFIGARGLVDLAHELVQIWGFNAMGKTRDYFDFGNFWDVFRALLAILLFHLGTWDLVQVTLIIIYWTRLFEVSFSENLMRELLPITRLVRGLAPSTAVCFIGFCAFTHAKWVLYMRPLWPETGYESFSLLMTASLPTADTGTFELLFSYFAILTFSIFFLNIFICVICENYTIERGRNDTSFQFKRAGLCFTFLCRATVLPTNLVSTEVAHATCCIAALGIITLTGCGFIGVGTSPTLRVLMFMLCQACMILGSYQCPAARYARSCGPTSEEKHYLWVAVPAAMEPPTQEDRVEESMADLRTQVQEMRKDMQSLHTLLANWQSAGGPPGATAAGTPAQEEAPRPSDTAASQPGRAPGATQAASSVSARKLRRLL